MSTTPFERYLTKFAENILRGNVDMAVMQDRFVAAGLWSDEIETHYAAIMAAHKFVGDQHGDFYQNRV